MAQVPVDAGLVHVREQSRRPPARRRHGINQGFAKGCDLEDRVADATQPVIDGSRILIGVEAQRTQREECGLLGRRLQERSLRVQVRLFDVDDSIPVRSAERIFKSEPEALGGVQALMEEVTGRAAEKAPEDPATTPAAEPATPPATKTKTKAPGEARSAKKR